MKSLLYNKYTSFFKNIDNLLLITLLLLSFLSTFYLRENLKNIIGLGPHCLIFFIPFTLYSFYQIFFQNKNFNIIKFLIFIFISFIPAYSFFYTKINFIPGDDSYAYLKFAHHMIDNFTFTLTEDLIPYHRQPGAAYFYAIELIFLNHENRLLQLLNLIIYFIIFFYVVEFLSNYFDKNNHIIISILIILSIPFSIKAILSFYGEWIAIVITFLAFLSYVNKKYFIFIILLALLPFIRQNLIFASIFVFIIFIGKIYFIEKKIHYSLIIIYFFILLIPVYHNLYYANSFAFFVKYIPDETLMPYGNNSIAWAFFIEDLLSFKIPVFNFLLTVKELFIQRVRNFLLMDLSFRNLILSIFIAPSLIYFLYSVFFKNNNLNQILLLLILFFLIFIPSMIGAGNFPRHDHVTIYCSFIFFFAVKINSKFKNNI